MKNLAELRTQFPAAPEYVTQIFLIHRDYGSVPNARLADRLGVSRPAVSQAVGRLKKLGLVNQDRYGDIGLTDDGRNLAIEVVKRHFLLEHLLVGVLGYPWDKSDPEAESLQTAVSEELTTYLDERLGFPQTCPHGNPLPGTPNERQLLDAPKLTTIAGESDVEVIRITEEGELTDGMLSFCQENGLSPGAKVRVIAVADDEVECHLLPKGETIRIPPNYAPHIRYGALS